MLLCFAVNNYVRAEAHFPLKTLSSKQWYCCPGLLQLFSFLNISPLLYVFFQSGQKWWSLRNITIWAENLTIWLVLQLKIAGDEKKLTNVSRLLPPVSVKMSLLKIKHVVRSCTLPIVWLQGNVRPSWKRSFFLKERKERHHKGTKTNFKFVVLDWFQT